MTCEASDMYDFCSRRLSFWPSLRAWLGNKRCQPWIFSRFSGSVSASLSLNKVLPWWGIACQMQHWNHSLLHAVVWIGTSTYRHVVSHQALGSSFLHSPHCSSPRVRQIDACASRVATIATVSTTDQQSHRGSPVNPSSTLTLLEWIQSWFSFRAFWSHIQPEHWRTSWHVMACSARICPHPWPRSPGRLFVAKLRLAWPGTGWIQWHISNSQALRQTAKQQTRRYTDPTRALV